MSVSGAFLAIQRELVVSSLVVHVPKRNVQDITGHPVGAQCEVKGGAKMLSIRGREVRIVGFHTIHLMLLRSTKTLCGRSIKNMEIWSGKPSETEIEEELECRLCKGKWERREQE